MSYPLALSDGGERSVPVKSKGPARELIIVNRFALRTRHSFISRLRSRFADSVFAEPETAERYFDAPGRLPFDRVTVSGGDGTLNRFLGRILKAGVPVRVIPAGTANDLAAEVGIPAGLPADECRSVREIDVLDASGKPFTTVGYLGFGSDVVRTVNEIRKAPITWPIQRVIGKVIYVLGVAWVALRGRLPLYRLRIETEGTVRELETPLVVAANQPRVGGTMTLAGGTRNDDGAFRLLVFRQRGGLSLLRAIVALCRGVAPEQAGVDSVETTRAEILSRDGKPFLFCADGEELVEGLTLSLRIHPQRLKLLVR